MDVWLGAADVNLTIEAVDITASYSNRFFTHAYLFLWQFEMGGRIVGEIVNNLDCQQ